ncbi:MAG TPA: arylsulfotransferase family protein [Solirubrobacteraceae bacterium]|nr:arylsulfotransferase family protein [Solirubrobacteraceae bacterium]
MTSYRQRPQRRLERGRAALLAALLPAMLLGCAGLCACGGTTSATSATLGTSSAAIAASAPVGVSPQPGTPDASPSTQISFLGGPGTQVGDVRVTGSSSGAHTGVLRAYSTGAGESFLPSHPFRSGERVTVHALADGAAVGTTFTIAKQAAVNQKEFPINAGDPSAVQHYSTAPSLTPSTVRITTPARAGAAPGYLFLAPYQGSGSPGPMIADQAGNLVWFQPLPPGVEATNFQVQQYEGKPVLTWWQGRIIEVGFGEGEDVVDDSSYHRIVTIRAGNGYQADLHAIRITPEGTAWIDAFDPIHMNLSSVHGPSNGVLTDSVVQEVDIKTGLVMWEWHTLGHIPLSDSNNPVPRSYPWDYAHLNSAVPGSADDVLVSVRNTWTLYDVDLRTGAIVWRLGGRNGSSFKLGAGTRFYWQHDAELQPGGLISVFDNGSDPPKEKQSRGLLLRPNLADHTVTLVKQFANPTKTLLAESQGNTLSLPGGDWLLGYGRLPNFTEFDASGHVLLDGTLGKEVQDFKTFLSPWSGQPMTRPSVRAGGAGAGAVSISVSWNGATEVASWRVLAGASAGALAPVATVAKAGFQTTVTVHSAGPDFAVQALDGSGSVLGTSSTVTG